MRVMTTDVVLCMATDVVLCMTTDVVLCKIAKFYHGENYVLVASNKATICTSDQQDLRGHHVYVFGK